MVVNKKSLFQRGALKEVHTQGCAEKGEVFLTRRQKKKKKKKLHEKNSSKILCLGKSAKVRVSSSYALSTEL